MEPVERSAPSLKATAPRLARVLPPRDTASLETCIPWMTWEEIGKHEDFPERYLALVRAKGQPWWEGTRAAKDTRCSKWVGEMLGWETRAATAAMPSDANTLMGRMGLHFAADTPGPFSFNARRVLRGKPPKLMRSVFERELRARLGDRRRTCGPRRRPGGSRRRGCARTSRGDPGDGEGEPHPAGGCSRREAGQST
jgi:hypothetical protein